MNCLSLGGVDNFGGGVSADAASHGLGLSTDCMSNELGATRGDLTGTVTTEAVGEFNVTYGESLWLRTRSL